MDLVKRIEVQEHTYSNLSEFQSVINQHRVPLVLRNVDLGPCMTQWTNTNYLKSKLDTPVRIHVSSVGSMSFIHKNFTYQTLPFHEFIDKASSPPPHEFYYLRALGTDRRGRDIANLNEHFPSLAADLSLPQLFEPDNFFSSVLRVSSQGVQIWTHYDIMDNMLVQITGHKKVVLFPPTDAQYLYLEGDKSQVINIDCPDVELYPKFVHATRHEVTLSPGDILFIPALWFHNTLALSFGVGVNVFWKHLPHHMYDKSDVYGNKDLVQANKALSLIEKAAQLIDELPEDYRDFYRTRALGCLHKKWDLQ